VQQIIVLRKGKASEVASTVKKSRVFQVSGTVLLGLDDIDTADPQSHSDGTTHVNVKVEPDAHRCFFRKSNFWRRRGSEAFRTSWTCPQK